MRKHLLAISGAVVFSDWVTQISGDVTCTAEYTSKDEVQTNTFTCSSGTHCCGRTCCDDDDDEDFYKLWYFWFISLFTLLLLIALVATFLQYKYKIMPARKKAEEEEERVKPCRLIVVNGLHPNGDMGLAPVELATHPGTAQPAAVPGPSSAGPGHPGTGLSQLVTTAMQHEAGNSAAAVLYPTGSTTVTTVTMETKWNAVTTDVMEASKAPPAVS